MKVTIHIYREQYAWEIDQRIGVYSFKHENTPERMFIESREIDIPDVAPLTAMQLAEAKAVELRAEAERLQAACANEVRKINDAISTLRDEAKNEHM